MADITMCADKKCPSRQQCYRFTAIANPFRQSVQDWERPPDAERCGDFWDNSGRSPAVTRKHLRNDGVGDRKKLRKAGG